MPTLVRDMTHYMLVCLDHSIIPTLFFVGMVPTQLVPSNVIKVLSYVMLVLSIYLFIFLYILNLNNK